MEKQTMRNLATGVLIGLSAIGGVQAQHSVEPPDRYRWLEDVTFEKSLEWVRQHNAVARQEIEGQPQQARIWALTYTFLLNQLK
jgi:hypothetical protein